jgi:hypothetical protein
MQLTTPTDKVAGVSAKYASGGDIPVSITKTSTTRNGITYAYDEVDVKFPHPTAGVQTWQFSVSYLDTGLVDTHGDAHTVYVPQVAPVPLGNTYSATVSVPKDFGSAHFVGVKASSMGTVKGRSLYSFTQDELTNQSLALAFGSTNIYEVNFKFPLRNNGLLATTETISLPPNLDNQQVIIQSLSPKPLNTRVDADGNILATYSVPAHTTETVQTKVVGVVNYQEYDLSKSGLKRAIPKDLVTRYTQSTHYWPTNGSVAAEAAKLSSNNRPVIDNVKAMYQYVVGHLTYNVNKIKFNIRQGATKALANPTNVVCLEYSDLLIAMLRSQGIPARMPIGYGYTGSLNKSDSVSDSLHSWVQAYVPGIGWMDLDPTWGEKFNAFGDFDIDHFAFALWGTSDQDPAAVAGSSGSEYQYEQTELTYLPFAPSLSSESASASATQYVIVPFVSVEQAHIVATPQVTTTGNSVVTGSHSATLGTLGPSQSANVYTMQLGSGWNTSTSVRLVGAHSDVLASSSSRVDYRYMWLMVALIAFACILTGVIRWRAKQKQSMQKNTGAL